MLDPLHSLKAKITGGSPKPSDTEKLLAEDAAAMEQNAAWLRKQKEKMEGLSE